MAFKGLLERGLKQPGYHPNKNHHFPYDHALRQNTALPGGVRKGVRNGFQDHKNYSRFFAHLVPNFLEVPPIYATQLVFFLGKSFKITRTIWKIKFRVPPFREGRIYKTTPDLDIPAISRGGQPTSIVSNLRFDLFSPPPALKKNRSLVSWFLIICCAPKKKGHQKQHIQLGI